LLILFIFEVDEEKRKEYVAQASNRSFKFRDGMFLKFVKNLVKRFKINNKLLKELNEVLETNIELKKKVRSRKCSEASYTDANINDYFKKQEKNDTPKDFSTIIKTLFKTHSNTVTKEEYTTNPETGSKDLTVSRFQVELVSPSYNNLFTNEYSKMSFESNIKRPFSYNQGCSSAKTLSYSSYCGSVSSFSFNPGRTASSENIDTNSNHSSCKASGINSLLSYKVNTLPKLKKNRTPLSKKKQKKSFLLELFENKLKTNVESPKIPKTEFPLRKVVNKIFYKNQGYLSPPKIEKQPEVNYPFDGVCMEASQSETDLEAIRQKNLLNRKRFLSSPVKTRSAYKKSRKNSRLSNLTDDEVIEYCTPVKLERMKEFQIAQSPRRNLSILFKQFSK
jgi:hypothetical protein